MSTRAVAGRQSRSRGHGLAPPPPAPRATVRLREPRRQGRRLPLGRACWCARAAPGAARSRASARLSGGCHRRQVRDHRWAVPAPRHRAARWTRVSALGGERPRRRSFSRRAAAASPPPPPSSSPPPPPHPSVLVPACPPPAPGSQPRSHRRPHPPSPSVSLVGRRWCQRRRGGSRGSGGDDGGDAGGGGGGGGRGASGG